MSNKDKGEGHRRTSVSIQGPTFHGGGGGFHVGGNFSADINTYVGGAELSEQVDRLVRELATADLLRNVDLAQKVKELAVASSTGVRSKSRIQMLVHQIEGHPALAAGIPAGATAAIEAINLLVS